MPLSYGVSTLNEQEVRSNYSKLNLNIFKEFGATRFAFSTKYKAMIFDGIDSLENAQNCFNKFIDINQKNNIHSYDQSLEESIIDSGENISPEALDELKKLNTKFVSNSKDIIDTFYKKNYICKDRCFAYILLKNSDYGVDNIKNKLRDLVETGLDFS
jgi:hypothetical protein